jgi:hypothetical protein
MDYSFNGTNQACLPIAHMEAMQFGSTLPRLLQCLVYCNHHYGPLLMEKIDTANGYCRIPLSPNAALALAVINPTDLKNKNDHLIAIPLTFPMGWSYSLPFFCDFTKTIVDITNAMTVAPLHPSLKSK